MTTIVTDIERGGRYLLLGGGYASDRIERPHAIFGQMAPTMDETQHSLVLVANERGQIGWVEVSHLRVISVDGLSPEEALAMPVPQDEVRE